MPATQTQTDWNAYAAQQADEVKLQMIRTSGEHAPDVAARINAALLDEWLFLTSPDAGDVLAERAWLRGGAASGLF